jgi:hypothetical protein
MSQLRTTDILETSIGSYGGKYIANTNATTPDAGRRFVAIQVITDCVITLVGNITGITTVALTAGTIIYGRYTSVTLASGRVIAYQGV